MSKSIAYSLQSLKIKERMREIKFGENNPMYEKIHSDKTKKK